MLLKRALRKLKEDLKASVTIDLTNIQRALHKAYINAR